ncbi:MAG: hypothetical protein ACFFBT_09935 [Promethearchaeota archaeon]
MGGVTGSIGGVFIILITWGITYIFIKRCDEQTLTGLTEEEIKVREVKKLIR